MVRSVIFNIIYKNDFILNILLTETLKEALKVEKKKTASSESESGGEKRKKKANTKYRDDSLSPYPSEPQGKICF